jgi:dTDP-4-amino-4,6-dideoxygalactose transaminase/lipopolysaccharide/colanic/teichoic acid biosynthesis glycosyltransferase
MTISQTQRFLDFCCAAAGLLLLSPLVAVIALLVKVHDGGPIFSRACKVGKRGKQFNLLNFRTVILNARKPATGVADHGDDRLTPIGRFLHKTQLEELPQLLNVIKGDMSLVGPRPEVPEFVALYTPEQRKVLEFRPGLVSPLSLLFRNEESLLNGKDWARDYRENILPHKLQLELEYLRHRSFLGDLLILAKNILAMVLLNETFLGMVLALRNRHLLIADIVFALAVPTLALSYVVDGVDDFSYHVPGLILYTLMSIAIKMAVFVPARLYDRYWRYAGVQDLGTLVFACFVASAGIIVVFVMAHVTLGVIRPGFPRSVPLVDSALTLIEVSGIRFILRVSFEFNERYRTVVLRKRVAIAGADFAGALIVKEMRSNPHLGLMPVCFLDDDAYKQGMRIHGVPVLGRLADIPKVILSESIERVVVAMPRTSTEKVKQVLALCKIAGVPTSVVPRISELLALPVGEEDIPDADLADIIRRDGVDTSEPDVTALVDKMPETDSRSTLPEITPAAASKQFLPFALPDLDDRELAEIKQSLESGWVTTGPKTKQFEADFAAAVGARYAIAVNSCTAALHLALEAVGTKAGDEVITSPYTFAATAEVIRYFDARPVFVDVERQTLNLNPDLLRRAITSRTKAIVPVHIAGLSADLDRICDVANQHNLAVVEDAAHAFPSSYNGQLVGSIGDLTCFSFYATKTLTTGEGGMVCTNNEAYADRCRIMSLHGISRDAWKRYTAEGSWYYEILSPGFKYNLTDLASAVGLAQLRKADQMWKRRKEIAARYDAAFSTFEELETPHDNPKHQHSWHLYMLRLNLENMSIDRGEFIEALKQRKIGASVHFIPLHIHPYYRDTYGYKPSDFPVALGEYQREVSLPIYSKMSDSDVADVIEAVTGILGKTQG